MTNKLAWTDLEPNNTDSFHITKTDNLMPQDGNYHQYNHKVLHTTIIKDRQGGYSYKMGINCYQLDKNKGRVYRVKGVTLFRLTELSQGQISAPLSIYRLFTSLFTGSKKALSCNILVDVLTEVCSLENIASWNWQKLAVAWSDSVLLTLRWLVCMWKTCRKGG